MQPLLEQPRRLLVVDDHAMFRDSVVRVLADQPDFDVVGVAGTIAEAMVEIGATLPEIVLLDSRLPDGDGVAAARRITAAENPPLIVFVTGFPDAATVRSAERAGCRAVISKDRSASELLDAIRAAARGASVILVPSADGADTSGLSSRELEVLSCLADGLSTNEMVDHMFISRNTVRSHVQRILEKLGAHSKLEAVAIARRDDLV